MTCLTLYDLFTLLILPIGTSGTNQIQYMKYLSEYISKLQIHQQLDLPCQDWDSEVRWDAFGDDLVHCSRATYQSWYTQYRGAYQLETGIFGEIRYTLPWFDFCSMMYIKKPLFIMLGWLWWPMLLSIIALTCVMTNQGTWCVDCCSCHACTNTKP